MTIEMVRGLLAAKRKQICRLRADLADLDDCRACGGTGITEDRGEDGYRSVTCSCVAEAAAIREQLEACQ
jgi:hypothetical protein